LHAQGKPVVLIFLDCEGMNSWERLEIEDQLLALLSASLSNLTLLKTHFTFDRYVSQMLQRFNLGASKVISMCGGSSSPSKVYRGSLMFALKDTQVNLLAQLPPLMCRRISPRSNLVSLGYNWHVTLYIEAQGIERDTKWPICSDADSIGHSWQLQ